MKVHIDHDEQFPVFFIVDSLDEKDYDPDGAVEMSDAELARYTQAADEWESVQTVLRERSGWDD